MLYPQKPLGQKNPNCMEASSGSEDLIMIPGSRSGPQWREFYIFTWENKDKNL